MLQRKPVRIVSTLVLSLSLVFLSAIPVGALTAKDITITKLQTFLQSKGFLVIPKGDTKGSFGPATKQALIKYQKSVGLSAQGVFGTKTKATITAELSGASRPVSANGTTTQESTQLATSSAAFSSSTTTQTLANADQPVTEASLNARLQAIYRQIALSQHIDQLNNTTITGGSISGTAISGLSTNTVGEGTNLYYTDGRTDARLSATSSLPNITTLSGLTSIGTSGTATTFNGNVAIGTTVVNSVTGIPTTLGQKLRYQAATASVSNPVINTALITPSGWVASTTYFVGNVVANGGNIYICYTAGTSAGSGGPTGTGAGTITDNTVVWYYYGVASVSATNFPTLAEDTSVPAALTNYYNVISSASSFSLAGGAPSTFASAAYQFPATTISATVAGNASAHGNNITASVTFWTDAPKFTIAHYGDAPYRLIVDGQYVTLSGRHPIYTGGYGYSTVDYTSAGGRKARKITIEDGLNWYFRGVYVLPADKVWAPSTLNNLRVAVVGDSIVAGGNAIPIIPSDAWPALVGKLLGWTDVWNMGIGGTGYINQGAGNAYYNFGQHVSDVTGNNPDLVVISGGLNDTSNSAATVTAAALAYFQAIRAGLPNVPIIVFGVYPASTGPSAAVITTETAIKSAVTAFNDPKTYFIPVATDTTGSWLTGTGKVSATTGTGNADVYTNPDGTHPTEGGISYFAHRAAAAIRQVMAQIN